MKAFIAKSSEELLFICLPGLKASRCAQDSLMPTYSDFPNVISETYL